MKHVEDPLVDYLSLRWDTLLLEEGWYLGSGYWPVYREQLATCKSHKKQAEKWHVHGLISGEAVE